MKFGDKLKQLRNERGYTQPQLAELAGIEQSYLSKLENERSVPSGDIFTKLLEVLEISLADFMENLDPKSERQLKQIPEVAQHFQAHQLQIISNRKRWLINCSILFVLGFGTVFAGFQKVFFQEYVYNYASEGIVLAGESKEIFSNWDKSIPRPLTSSREDMRKSNAIRETERLKMYQRKDEAYQISYDYKGRQFNVPVEGGSRTFHMVKDVETPRWQNKFLMLIGVLFAVAGIMGLIIERKASH